MSAEPLPTAAASTEEHVAVCLLDGAGRVLHEQDADRPFYAASTIKLHVLLAALQAAQGGALDLDDKVPATRSFVGADGRPFTLGGDHLEPTHPAEGVPIAVRELLVRLIDRSSNEATDHIVALLGGGVGAPPEQGLAAVAGTIARLGLAATRVERLIGDASAITAGATNETSARDLARTVHALAGDPDLLGDDARTLALDALRAQRIRVITTVLRDGVDAGSKTGWVEGYRHDVAVIGEAGSPERRVLAVLTSGLPQDEADARIVAAARELLPQDVLRPA